MMHADILSIPSLTLAYIGDAVYELYVRRHLIESGMTDVNELHKKAVKYVSAISQSRFLLAMHDMLTEEEGDVIRRGRNAKINTKPSSCDLQDYKRATALEALIGYLYMSGRMDRIKVIMESIFENQVRHITDCK